MPDRSWWSNSPVLPKGEQHAGHQVPPGCGSRDLHRQPRAGPLHAYVQLYNDTADGIIGGEYAPAWDEFSPWLSLR
jgi:hypothetical protein